MSDEDVGRERLENERKTLVDSQDFRPGKDDRNRHPLDRSTFTSPPNHNPNPPIDSVGTSLTEPLPDTRIPQVR